MRPTLDAVLDRSADRSPGPAADLLGCRDTELCVSREFALAERGRHSISLILIKLRDPIGHTLEAGEPTFAALSRALATSCRATDFAGCLAPDELVVVAPHTDERQASVLARAIGVGIERERSRLRPSERDALMQLNVTIGVATPKARVA